MEQNSDPAQNTNQGCSQGENAGNTQVQELRKKTYSELQNENEVMMAVLKQIAAICHTKTNKQNQCCEEIRTVLYANVMLEKRLVHETGGTGSFVWKTKPNKSYMLSTRQSRSRE
jgi:hypothetical protein